MLPEPSARHLPAKQSFENKCVQAGAWEREIASTSSRSQGDSRKPREPAMECGGRAKSEPASFSRRHRFRTDGAWAGGSACDAPGSRCLPPPTPKAVSALVPRSATAVQNSVPRGFSLVPKLGLGTCLRAKLCFAAVGAGNGVAGTRALPNGVWERGDALKQPEPKKHP